jgi:trimethylamine:corrinoid methyltransferase-like protein
LYAMLAGASAIYGPGMLESGVTFDIAQLVADAELIAMCRYGQRGIAVNDGTTFIEEIIAVGPSGNYLDRDSTLKGMRALSSCRILDRSSRPAWEEAGAPQYYETARRDARKLLAEHAVRPLADGVAEQLRVIVDQSDRDLAGVLA